MPTMAVLYLAILLGAGVWISLFLFLGVMILTMGLFSGEGEYILRSEGVYKKVIPFLSLSFKRKERIWFHSWNEIKSFKCGKDMNRSLQEYEYLWIRFNGGSAWQITNQKNDSEFQQFKNNFIRIVRQLNKEAEDYSVTTGKNLDTFSPSAHLTHPIRQKKTFYETVWAKIFVWLMVAFITGISIVFIKDPQLLSSHSFFRIIYIIIPGIGYILYRVYWKRK